MKRVNRLLVAVAVILGLSVGAVLVTVRAQNPGGSPTTQTSYHADACNVTQTATGAGNITVTAAVPAITGQTFNLCTATVDEVANAAITGAAGPAGVLTTAGLPVNLIWVADNATQTTGWQKEVMKESWPNGLKAQANTAFSLAQTGGQSTQTFRINLTGFYSIP